MVKTTRVVLLNIYRNGRQAATASASSPVATSRCEGLQTFPAVMKITQRTPISVHNAKAGDVDGAEFHHIAGPVVIHDLHRTRWREREREGEKRGRENKAKHLKKRE